MILGKERTALEATSEISGNLLNLLTVKNCKMKDSFY